MTCHPGEGEVMPALQVHRMTDVPYIVSFDSSAARRYVAGNCRWTSAAARCEAPYRALVRAGA
jgi:hypothetical protein